MKKFLEIILKIDIKNEQRDICLEEIYKEINNFGDHIENDIVENQDNITISLLKNKGDIKGLADFKEEGKIIKEIGLKYDIFTTDNYISFFQIKDVPNNLNNQKNINEEDPSKYIREVPKDDPKVQAILQMVAKLKK